MEISCQKRPSRASGRERVKNIPAYDVTAIQTVNIQIFAVEQKKWRGQRMEIKSLVEWTPRRAGIKKLEPQKKKISHTNVCVFGWIKFKVEDMAIAIVLLFKKLDVQRHARRIQIQNFNSFLLRTKMTSKYGRKNPGKNKIKNAVLVVSCVVHEENSIKLFPFYHMHLYSILLAASWCGIVRLLLLRTENNNFAFWFNFEYKFS